MSNKENEFQRLANAVREKEQRRREAQQRTILEREQEEKKEKDDAEALAEFEFRILQESGVIAIFQRLRDEGVVKMSEDPICEWEKGSRLMSLLGLGEWETTVDQCAPNKYWRVRRIIHNHVPAEIELDMMGKRKPTIKIKFNGRHYIHSNGKGYFLDYDYVEVVSENGGLTVRSRKGEILVDKMDNLISVLEIALINPNRYVGFDPDGGIDY